MARLDELYDLIHSMGKSEKRSLRISLTAAKKSKPEQLLDVLLAFTRYEEAPLLATIKEKGLQDGLPTHMLRLRKTIVRHQLSLGSEKTVDAQLRFALGEIDLLFRKKLLEQMPARMRRAHKLATRFSRFPQQLELIGIERRYRLETEPNRIQEIYAQLREEELTVIRALVLQRQVADLQIRMRSLSRDVLHAATDADRKRFVDIASHPALSDALSSSDFLTIVHACNTMGLYHIAMKEYVEASKSYTRLMDLWKSDPAWINVQPDLFLVSFNNYYINVMLGPESDYILPEAYARFFDRQQFEDPFIRLRFNRIYYGNEMARCLNNGRFEEGKEFVREYEVWIDEVAEQLPKATLLPSYYNLAIFYFLSGQSSKANRSVQAILSLKEGEQRRDIRSFAVLLEMVLQWDMGNEDIIEYRLRAANRYFSQKTHSMAVANALMTFFKIEKTLSPMKLRYEKLRENLNAIQGAQLGLTEMNLWVKSKLENRAITEVFLEHIGQL